MEKVSGMLTCHGIDRGAHKHTALIVRHLQPLNAAARLSSFGLKHNLGIYTQSGGPATIAPLLLPEGFELSYGLDDLQLYFAPGNFVQNNLVLNRKMVAQVLDWLQPQRKEQAVDLFCGIGNFSLPLAKRCKSLVGVEGGTQNVLRASANARLNKLGNTSFYTSDLANRLALEQQAPSWWQAAYDIALLDPPRSGAVALTKWLSTQINKRLIYISCNPAILAQDLTELAPYFRIARAGIIDMFAHSAHCEVMCLLTRK